MDCTLRLNFAGVNVLDQAWEEMKAREKHWDKRFLQLAEIVSSWSKDPSTQTGAVITDDLNRVISVGFNGFPIGVKDHKERYENRELKYKMIVHCEMNAILFAKGGCENCTLYTYPLLSCSRCAASVIQAGITRCVAPKLDPESPLGKRWSEELELSLLMFKESGVEITLLD